MSHNASKDNALLIISIVRIRHRDTMCRRDRFDEGYNVALSLEDYAAPPTENYLPYLHRAFGNLDDSSDGSSRCPMRDWRVLRSLWQNLQRFCELALLSADVTLD